MATDHDLLVARICLRAILPVVKVLLEDDPKTARKFFNTHAIVQFIANDEKGPVGAYLQFIEGGVEVVQEIAEHPDLTFRFSSIAKMNAMLPASRCCRRFAAGPGWACSGTCWDC